MVPPTGFTARLTVFAAAAMAFLAVFALALSLATGRLADRWAAELARTATMRISAPADQMEAQTARGAGAVADHAGHCRGARPDQRGAARAAGPVVRPRPAAGHPADPAPDRDRADRDGYDATGLRARLQAEVPGAVLDDHTRWREPLVAAAKRLRSLGCLSLALIAVTMAAIITLAAQAALSANAQVIRVMRLVGARDIYIARAFVRRFTLRALAGAAGGTAAGHGGGLRCCRAPMPAGVS